MVLKGECGGPVKKEGVVVLHGGCDNPARRAPVVILSGGSQTHPWKWVFHAKFSMDST